MLIVEIYVFRMYFLATSMYWLILYVNLTEARVIRREEGTLVEKMSHGVAYQLVINGGGPSP